MQGVLGELLSRAVSSTQIVQNKYEKGNGKERTRNEESSGINTWLGMGQVQR